MYGGIGCALDFMRWRGCRFEVTKELINLGVNLGGSILEGDDAGFKSVINLPLIIKFQANHLKSFV
jgi:hypothetical protein